MPANDLPASLLGGWRTPESLQVNALLCYEESLQNSVSMPCNESKEGRTHAQRLQLHALLAGQAGLGKLVDEAPADVTGAQASQPRVQALLQHRRRPSACLARQRSRRLSLECRCLCTTGSLLSGKVPNIDCWAFTYRSSQSMQGLQLLWLAVGLLCTSCAEARQQARSGA